MKISVVIPAYNEENYLKSTLESLKKQALKPFEIIVVDNGSTDKTGEVAKSLGVKVILEKKKGIGFARKIGFEEALGDIIATTDADTILPKDWLLKISKTFKKNSNIIAVGGPYNFNTNKYKLIIKIVSKIWIFGDRILNSGNNIPGVNMAVLKKAYFKVGGFREINYFEDLDLSLRLKKIGKVVFLKDLLVTTSFRRYQEKGIFKTIIRYMSDYFRFIFKRSEIHMDDVRTKK